MLVLVGRFRIFRKSQLRLFTAEVFEPSRGLFVAGANGKFGLWEGEVDDEAQHLLNLRRAGLLVGKSIQCFLSIDFALDQDPYYRRLEYRGACLEEDRLSGVMEERVRVFIGGIFKIIPCDAFKVFGQLEIARLFEWRLPLSVETIQNFLTVPYCKPRSTLCTGLTNFWLALKLLPRSVLNLFVSRATRVFRIPHQGLNLRPRIGFNINTDYDMHFVSLPNGAVTAVTIPILETAEEYLAAICAGLVDGDDEGMSRTLVKSMRLSLNKRLEALRRLTEGRGEGATLTVTRDDVVGSTFESYQRKQPEFKPGVWTIRFQLQDGWVEAGQDRGGMFNEWMSMLSERLMAPEAGLLSISPDGTHQVLGPDSMPGGEPDQSQKYEFFGTIVARALLSKITISIHLAPIMYRMMLYDGMMSDADRYAVLGDLDPEMHKHLGWVRKNEVEGLELDFVAYDASEERVAVPLIEGGEGVAVTEENKEKYLSLMVRHVLFGKGSNNAHAFIRGFHAILSAQRLATFWLGPDDIRKVLYGREEMSVKEWKEHTVYESTTTFFSDNVVPWFWRVLNGFSPDQLQQLLGFCTGLLHLPLNGFKGIPTGVFTIKESTSSSNEALPKASTCFSILELHPYTSEEQLRSKLLKAVELGGKGFALASKGRGRVVDCQGQPRRSCSHRHSSKYGGALRCAELREPVNSPLCTLLKHF